MGPCKCGGRVRPHPWAPSCTAAQSNVTAALINWKLLSLKLQAWAILLWECHYFFFFFLFVSIFNISIINTDYLINCNLKNLQLFVAAWSNKTSGFLLFIFLVASKFSTFLNLQIFRITFIIWKKNYNEKKIWQTFVAEQDITFLDQKSDSYKPW